VIIDSIDITGTVGECNKLHIDMKNKRNETHIKAFQASQFPLIGLSLTVDLNLFKFIVIMSSAEAIT
jgi:hypothetical protein